MSTLLGSTSDGRMLTYDASLYEFSLDGQFAAFSDVKTLDVRNWVRWRAPELRDWFRHIVAADLDACNKRARAQKAYSQPGQQASTSRTSSVAARMAAAQMAAQAVAQKKVQAAANTTLEYRSEDASVASVDDQGVVRIVGPGYAGIYARRVGPGGAGPEMRVVTIAIKESDLAEPDIEDEQNQREEFSNQPVEADDSIKTVETAETVETVEAVVEEAPAQEVEPVEQEEPAQAVEPLEWEKPTQTAEPIEQETSVEIPVMKIRTNVVKNYKSKGGMLTKDKHFQLESLMDYPPLFQKLEGSPFLEVSSDGSVVVRSGLKSGLYTAKVAVAPADGRQIRKGEVITVSVKVR